MTRPLQQLWDRFKRYDAEFPTIGQSSGRSRINFAGLLRAALQGFEIDAMLHKAKAHNEINRIANIKANVMIRLASLWLYSGNGNGSKYFVFWPYAAHLELFYRYFMQAVNDSLDENVSHCEKTFEHTFQCFCRGTWQSLHEKCHESIPLTIMCAFGFSINESSALWRGFAQYNI